MVRPSSKPSQKNEISYMYSDTLPLILSGNGIAVMKTDTIYGIVGKADSREAVERVYQAKGRTPSKSPIVLISSVTQLFDSYEPNVLNRLKEYWPGPNSIILPSQKAPEWIRRENHSVAYRLPDSPGLQALIEKAGPLIAPSANPEGLPPALTIAEARSYFGNSVDWYEDGGLVVNPNPSSLYLYRDGELEQLR